jgi:diguanylate cyclase (GGDEF)-like protein
MMPTQHETGREMSLDEEFTQAAALAAKGARRSEAALLEVFRELEDLHELALERPRVLVTALLGCLQARDPYTGTHSQAVHDLALRVAARLELPDAARDEVRAVALLHDLGKVALPDSVLRKDGPLDDDERAVAERHPVLGGQIVAAVPGLAPIAEGVRHEHERWDGAGYPTGLAGERIPLSSRIVAVCDAYHALVSDRPYRAGATPETGLAEVRSGSGTQFDPRVVDALGAVLGDPDQTGDHPVEAPPLFEGAARAPLSRDLEALLRIASAAGAAHAFEEVLEVAAEETRTALDAASVSVSRWERDRGCIRVLVNIGEPAPWEQRWPGQEVFELGLFPEVLKLLRDGEPYLNQVDDPTADAASVRLLRESGRGSEAAVPVFHDGQMWGELHATSASGRPVFGARHVRLLQAIAGILETAIARAELFSRMSTLAFQDPLTGLANRRALDDRLTEALAEAGDDGSVALVVADIDDFKARNDRFGHAVGDRVLREVADALGTVALEFTGALVARSGGDEFCVVLPSHSLAAAERFCRSASGLVRGAEEPPVTLAWGAASSADGARRSGDLFRLADAAQYTAKRSGPGAICVSAPDRGEPAARPSGRRRLRDARPALGALVPDALEAVDGLGSDATPLDRLEAVAASFAASLDAAGWVVCCVRHGETELRDERGMIGVLDPASGTRVVRLAPTATSDLAAHPASAHAVRTGTPYSAAVNDPECDAAEQRFLREHGLESSIGAGGRNEDHGYLVEIYGDARTPPLRAAAPHLRAAVAAAVAYPRSPAS